MGRLAQDIWPKPLNASKSWKIPKSLRQHNFASEKKDSSCLKGPCGWPVSYFVTSVPQATMGCTLARECQRKSRRDWHVTLNRPGKSYDTRQMSQQCPYNVHVHLSNSHKMHGDAQRTGENGCGASRQQSKPIYFCAGQWDFRDISKRSRLGNQGKVRV